LRSQQSGLRIGALDLDELVEIAERGLARSLTDDEWRQYPAGYG
jgi:hypothetical protein